MYKTKRLQLRPLALSDATQVEALAGEYDIAKTTLNIPHPYPKGGAVTWVTSVLENPEEGKTRRTFAITLENTFIGTITLGIVAAHNRAELAYWLGKEYWSKGYMTEAAERMLQIGFEEHHLNRIYAFAFAENPGSWTIMKKLGMAYEGTQRQHVMKWGKPIDLVCYGILKEEYETKKQSAK
jgi:[ribosomal protein S5]-alanine N-acetyltransferase